VITNSRAKLKQVNAVYLLKEYRKSFGVDIDIETLGEYLILVRGSIGDKKIVSLIDVRYF